MYVWFDYPVHTIDDEHILERRPGRPKKQEKGPDWGSEEARALGREAVMKYKADEKERNRNEFITAIDAVGPEVDAVCGYFSGELTPQAVKMRAKRYGFVAINGRFYDVQSLVGVTHAAESDT